MQVVTDRSEGLFPLPGEMSFQCSCPDWASMCKHVAAVLYGVGARLDEKPELLFALRGVNHDELIAADAEKAVAAATSRGKSKRLATAEIGEVFGIDLDSDGRTAAEGGDSIGAPRRKTMARRAAKKPRAEDQRDGKTSAGKRKSARSATRKRSKKKG